MSYVPTPPAPSPFPTLPDHGVIELGATGGDMWFAIGVGILAAICLVLGLPLAIRDWQAYRVRRRIFRYQKDYERKHPR